MPRPGVLSVAARVLLALVPGALAVYLAFRTGGYYPEGYSAVVLVLALGLGTAAITSRRPLAGFSTPLLVACGALALLVAWEWFSSAWSDAPVRALFESQRTALYLLALAFCGTFLRRRYSVDLALIGVATAILAVCVAALATRLYPDVFEIGRTLSRQRLSFPISYWNSLGAFAAIGVVLLLHLASSLRVHPAIRVVAAAGVPIAAATIYFTFSRGAVGAVALGVAAYLVVGHSRGMVAAALAVVPATALALKQAYAADLLGTVENTTAAAAQQGHEVAVWLVVAAGLGAGLRLCLLPLDRRLERIPPAGPRVRRALVVAAAVAALVGVGAAVALDAPGRVQEAYNAFTKPESGNDARTRLRQVTLSGREEHWNVALDYFRAHPLKGEGAGTYETQWLRSRDSGGTTGEAHSLYIEVLGELGLVGFVLIVAAIGALLAGLVMRARGERRAVYGALFAATLLWAVHAGVDWDWELPALGVPLFALAGIALARATPRASGPGRFASNWPARAVLALACVLVGLAAVRAVVADSAVDNAKRAFGHGDCQSARADAHTALSAVGTHPAAYEILGWCNLDDGREAAAVRDMREATRLDPKLWRYRYSLAIARAAAGRDPRPDVRLAKRLNPLGEIFSSGAALQLAHADRAWVRLARAAARPGN